MFIECFSWGVSKNDATEFYGTFIKAYKDDVKNWSKIEKPIIQGRSQLPKLSKCWRIIKINSFINFISIVELFCDSDLIGISIDFFVELINFHPFWDPGFSLNFSEILFYRRANLQHQSQLESDCNDPLLYYFKPSIVQS
jgi:hypothetical protein